MSRISVQRSFDPSVRDAICIRLSPFFTVYSTEPAGAAAWTVRRVGLAFGGAEAATGATGAGSTRAGGVAVAVPRSAVGVTASEVGGVVCGAGVFAALS